MSQQALAFEPGEEGPWDIFGETVTENPVPSLPAWCQELIAVWARCRPSETEPARLPDAGPVNDQACIVMAGFAVLEEALADYRDWLAGVRGGAR